MRILIITLFILVQSLAQTGGNEEKESLCKDLLHYIYKDLTLKNLDKSYERLNNKMLLAFIYALKNSDQYNYKLKNHPKLLSLFESMKRIDPDLETSINQNRPYQRYQFWSFFFSVETQNYHYQNIINEWYDLQQNEPTLFSDMPKNYFSIHGISRLPIFLKILIKFP